MGIIEIDDLIDRFDAVSTADEVICDAATEITKLLGVVAVQMERTGVKKLPVDLDRLLPVEEEEVPVFLGLGEK